MSFDQEINRIKQIYSHFGVLTEASKIDSLVKKLGFSEEDAKTLDLLCGSLSVWMGNKLIDDVKKQQSSLDAMRFGD